MTSCKLAILTIFHPITAFGYMKREREHMSKTPIVVILLFCIITRIIEIYFTHYPLANVEVRDANIAWECAKILVPVITWTVASYAITTIIDGETLFKEAAIANSYSMIPLVITSIPITLLTRIMEQGQSGIYYGLQTVVYAWMLLLMVISLKELNHYSGKKTVLIILLSLFTFAIIWATAALFFSISMQFITFIKEVLVEARYKF